MKDNLSSVSCAVSGLRVYSLWLNCLTWWQFFGQKCSFRLAVRNCARNAIMDAPFSSDWPSVVQAWVRPCAILDWISVRMLVQITNVFDCQLFFWWHIPIWSWLRIARSAVCHLVVTEGWLSKSPFFCMVVAIFSHFLVEKQFISELRCLIADFRMLRAASLILILGPEVIESFRIAISPVFSLEKNKRIGWRGRRTSKWEAKIPGQFFSLSVEILTYSIRMQAKRSYTQREF